jgi:pyruvate-formate lyase-activating enzyme
MTALFKAGLDSVRVSLNSVREACYKAYFRPKGYGFAHVLKSISEGIRDNIHMTVNYLNCPGFSDTPEEVEAFLDFLSSFPIGMIQWRNLNFDPLRYVYLMNQVASCSTPMGMDRLLKSVRKAYPLVRFGYFNPPKEAWHQIKRN